MGNLTLKMYKMFFLCEPPQSHKILWETLDHNLLEPTKERHKVFFCH